MILVMAKSVEHKELSVAGFAAAVLGTTESDIEPFVKEVESNRPFHAALAAKRKAKGREPRASVNDEVGTILYTICRHLKPDNVVETGVASGVSSSYFLCALGENKKGRLHSIDFPTWEQETGWIVPDDLKGRWELLRGRSADHLPGLLERLEKIGVFFHDGEHTYDNMTWEYESAWERLSPGSVLLSHNIDFTKAFPDFARKLGKTAWVFQNLGGIGKPYLDRKK